MNVLSFVSRRRIEFVIGQIHRANPHFGNLHFVDFDTQEVVLCSDRYRCPETYETYKYRIENEVLIYRGLKFAL